MVEVFKTNVQLENEAEIIVKKLTEQLPHCKINFDLMDSDNILRVEGNNLTAKSIIEYMNSWQYHCSLID